MKEIWVNCRDLEVPNDQYEVTELIQTGNRTRVTLIGFQNEIEIEVKSVDSLRVTDEGRRIRTYHEISEIQEYRNSFIGNPIFRIDHSEYLNWIKKESAGFSIGVVHYAVMTRNEIVDIATTENLKIKVTRKVSE